MHLFCLNEWTSSLVHLQTRIGKNSLFDFYFINYPTRLLVLAPNNNNLLHQLDNRVHVIMLKLNSHNTHNTYRNNNNNHINEQWLSVMILATSATLGTQQFTMRKTVTQTVPNQAAAIAVLVGIPLLQGSRLLVAGAESRIDYRQPSVNLQILILPLRRELNTRR